MHHGICNKPNNHNNYLDEVLHSTFVRTRPEALVSVTHDDTQRQTQLDIATQIVLKQIAIQLTAQKLSQNSNKNNKLTTLRQKK